MIHLLLLSGMILILSPAKTLNFAKVSSALLPRCSEPVCSLEKTKILADILKGKTKGELKALMGISDKIGATVFEVSFACCEMTRWQMWHLQNYMIVLQFI